MEAPRRRPYSRDICPPLPPIKTGQRRVRLEFRDPLSVLTSRCASRFDEVHFGKFAARYIKTRYFVDVHPPLAKLLITAAAFLSGFDGDFDFKDIGKWVPLDSPR